MTLRPFENFSKGRKIAMFSFSSIGLFVGALLGFHLAGVIAVFIFAPLGAAIGLLLGGLTLRMVIEAMCGILVFWP